MGWSEVIFMLFLYNVLHYADSKVIVRATDVTTRGKTFQVTCRVEDEELIGWFDKEGNQITSTNIFAAKYYVQSEPDTPNELTLYVVNVEVKDGGDYSCRGSKNIGNFELYVEFYVVEFPNSFTMNVGQSAIIPCKGIGYPKPANRWYKNWQSQELGRTSDDRYEKLANGSLYIKNVTVEDASNYTCRILQFEGKKVAAREERKHIQVIVYGPPVLNKKKSTNVVYSYQGNPIKVPISCSWWGFPIPNMNFTKPNRALLRDVSLSGRTINGYLSTTNKQDFGVYICFASNKLGTRRHKIYVKEADGPLSPVNITFSTYCGYITVLWSTPSFDGGLPIILYDLELIHNGKRVDDASAGSTKRRFTFNGGIIKPNTRYTVRVRGRNKAKEGTWYTEHVYSDICPPRGVSITNHQTRLNSTRFTLTWTGPHDNGGDPNVTYVIEYSKQDDDGKYVYWVTVKNITGKQYNVTGLQRGNKYQFRVVGVNRMGQSDAGEKEFLVTESAVTDKPPTTKPKDPEGELVYDFKVNCTSLVIQVDLTINNFPNIDRDSFRLRDPSCQPYKKTDSHVILRTRLDGCGTTNQHRNLSVTYYNSVTARVAKTPSKMHIVEFPFSCTFIKMRTIGTPSFQPRKKVSVVEEGFGNFSFEMNLYKSSQFKVPYDVSEYPVNVPVTKNLFAKTTLLSSDKNLEALAYTCIATPSINSKDQLQYSFIENG
ncbi:neural cell adhesion molecule 2-like isoform X2 [Actinia tenebrosa]|nr:neural cell adhesion molecule 2-like isoform X2 [Actinia tenebrosa]